MRKLMILLAIILMVAFIAYGDPPPPKNFSHVHLMPVPAGGIILQAQNQGTVLATRGGGLFIMNCTTGMSCSFSGSTFTITSTGGAGTVTASGPPSANQVAVWTSATNITGTASDSTTTHALFATAGAPAFRAIATSDLPTAIPIANVGTSGLSGTSPITISAAGAIACATCATTTNGGALSGTAPIAVSAAGVISGGGLGTVTGALKGNGSGTITQAACADLSNAAASCSTDTTSATNISAGTLNAARESATVVQTGQSNTYTTGTQSLASATALIVPTSGGAAPTANASIAFDSTANDWKVGGTEGGSASTITGFLPKTISLQGASTALDSGTIGTTETVFSISFAFPAAYFTAGKVVHVFVGFQGVTVGTAQTVILKMRVEKSGPTDVVLWQSATILPSTTSVTRTIAADFYLRCLTTGATGTIDTEANDGLTYGNGNQTQGVTTNPVTFDTTAAQTLQFTVTFGGTTAGDTQQIRQLIVQEMN